MSIRTFLLLISLVLLSSCSTKKFTSKNNVTTIALGSYLRQWKPQPVWKGISKTQPNALILMGDNVYADTRNPVEMQNAYDQLLLNPGFAKLFYSIPVFATWDDHDYGENDAGSEYPMKQMAQRIFMEFFKIPAEHPMRKHQGIYHTEYIQHANQSVQIILLDTRYFRSPLMMGKPNQHCPKSNILPNPSNKAAILGSQQWQWLENQLNQPASIRIIVSSIQIIPEQHCFEKWANFPAERNRLFNLIASSKAKNVILISGDRHLGEISQLQHSEVSYPVFELTASGLNSAGAGLGELNNHRLHEDNLRVDHFGLIRIDWQNETIHLDLRDINGDLLQTKIIRLKL